MDRTDVTIIGAGLSGLMAAGLLQDAGIDFRVIEARSRVGGRIKSVGAAEVGSGQLYGSCHDGTHEIKAGYDLGPAWYWPSFQNDLDRMIDGFGLARIAQFDHGDLIIERSPHVAPSRVAAYGSAPPSVRLAGGMQALVHSVYQSLTGRRVLLGHKVTSIGQVDEQISVQIETVDKQSRSIATRAVLLAVPPRIASECLSFSTPLPARLVEQWRSTPTWMAAHAKYLATFDTPFWRAAGLSGQARSTCGPLVEVHDASLNDGRGALFGFVGIAAKLRHDIGEDALREHCRTQLGRLFGAHALTPCTDFIMDWARECYTATPLDQLATNHQDHAPPASPSEGPWHGRLIGVASEFSPVFPGYIAGALDAATRGVERLLRTGMAAR